MFDVGFWELTLIAVVVLIVVGPERLPGMMRKAGMWIGKARRMVSELRAEVEREFQVEELKRSMSKQSGGEEIRHLADRIKAINTDLNADMRGAGGKPSGAGKPAGPGASKSSTE